MCVDKMAISTALPLEASCLACYSLV